MVQCNWLEIGQTYYGLRTVGELGNLTTMSSAMNRSLEIVQEELKKANTISQQSLAVQQEMLNRDSVQAGIEEFCFQLETVLKKFEDTPSDFPPSLQFFVIMNMLSVVENNAITTAIIRGREQKTIFLNSIEKAHSLIAVLKKDPDVIDALEWADAQEKKKNDMQTRVNEIEDKIQQINSDLKILSDQVIDTNFQVWYSNQFGKISILLQFILWMILGGYIWIPIIFVMHRNRYESKKTELEQKIQVLTSNREQLVQQKSSLNK